MPENPQKTCWSCSAELGNSPLLCPACNKVQPSAGIDYYQAFSLPRTFALATENGEPAPLEREFHRLSRRLHPDRFARATADEQQWSLAATALLNDAYRTLRDPIQRTEYLLKLEGHEIGEEHSGRDAKRQPPADLLEEVFDLNMQLEEMRMNRQMGEDDPNLQRDLTAASARFQTLLAEVDSDLAAQGKAWDTAEASPAGNSTRESAAKTMLTLLDRRRYLRNLVRDVTEVLST